MTERSGLDRAMRLAMDAEVRERIDRLEIPFNRYGLDRYGTSRDHLAVFFTLMGLLYRHYLTVHVSGIERVPDRGRAMLVGNHSGGVALDGGMIITSLILDRDPPRLGQGMAEKFAARMPLLAPWFSRIGQLTGLPEHAEQLLRDERLLVVFPEGARGTAKLFWDRYTLVRFGTGFMRLALQTGTPIVPVAFAGGGEAIPTVANLETLGRMVGAPYLPITPYLLPLPRPTRCAIAYGEPLVFEGNGDEPDDVIAAQVDQVKRRIGDLVEEARRMRRRFAAAAAARATAAGGAARGGHR